MVVSSKLSKYFVLDYTTRRAALTWLVTPIPTYFLTVLGAAPIHHSPHERPVVEHRQRRGGPGGVAGRQRAALAVEAPAAGARGSARRGGSAAQRPPPRAEVPRQMEGEGKKRQRRL